MIKLTENPKITKAIVGKIAVLKFISAQYNVKPISNAPMFQYFIYPKM